jgi:hypothetical protein
MLCVALTGFAQTPALVDPYAGLRSGKLVVWVISNTDDPHPMVRASLKTAQGPPQYQEQTAGSFGQTAGSVGQTAGSVGQTAGSLGQTAGSVGQTAGSTGQTAGSFGRPLPSKNAGDAGTTMGNFGVSTTDLQKASARANSTALASQKLERSKLWDAPLSRLGSQFPDIEITFVDVFRNDLQAMLEATAGTADSPDVLVGNPLPPEWSREDSEVGAKYGLAMLWTPLRVPQLEVAEPRGQLRPETAIVSSAQNLDGARSFAIWIADLGSENGTYVADVKTGKIAEVALRAELAMVGGGSLGSDADPQFAGFDHAIAALVLTGYRKTPEGRWDIRADVTGLEVFGDLAVATVRAIGSGPTAFGVAHAALVLRRDAATGRWRVLQISPNLAPELQYRAWDVLVKFCDGNARPGESGSAVLRNEGTQVLGVKLAAPADGDTRSAQPELWWDNLGGGTLQVVEWQQGVAGWTNSNLYFVPDNNSRLRTRVVARFATQGTYRWRVWSVGKGGSVVISPWRTVNIVAR